MRYRFADYTLDATCNQLQRSDGSQVELQPKVAGVLKVLLESDGRLVTKDELMDAVWPGIAITDGSIARAVSLARQALGDRYTDDGVIATIWGKGYRLTVPVTFMRGREGDEVLTGGPAVSAFRARVDAVLDTRYARPTPMDEVAREGVGA